MAQATPFATGQNGPVGVRTQETTTGTEPVKLSTVERTKLLAQVRRHYQEGQGARGDFPRRHRDRYRRYLADPTLRPAGPWPEAPKLFLEDTRKVTERLLAEFWQALFGQPESIRLVGFGEEDIAKAEVASQFARWTLRWAINDVERGGWWYLSAMALFDALIDSAGVLKVYPWRVPWQPPSALARRYLSDIIRVDPLDQEALVVPPDAEGLQYPACRYVHQELWLTRDDLARLEAQGYTLPDETTLAGQHKRLSERQREDQEREGHTVGSTEDEFVLLVEAYERFRLEGPFEEDLIVSWFPALDDDEALASVRRLTDVFPVTDRPLRPFFAITLWPQPRQWRGLNVPDRLESPQDLINRLHEQMLNYGDISILPFFFYNALLSGDLPNLREVRPGEGVPVSDLGGVQFSPRQSLNRHFIELIQLFKASVESDSQVTSFHLGRQSDRPNAPRTASATLALLQESRRSFSMLIQQLIYQFQAVLNFHFSLWQAKIPPGMQVPIQSNTVRGRSVRGPGSQDFDSGLLDSGPQTLLTLLGQQALGQPFTPQEAPGLVDQFGRPFAVEEGTLLERLFTASTPAQATARLITKEEVAGIFDVELQVSADAAFDRQVLLTLGQQLVPLLMQVYPLGAREVIKRLWEASGQRGFEQIYPEFVAKIQTQRLLHIVSAEQQQLAAQGQPQAPQGPHGPPGAVASPEAAMQEQAQGAQMGALLAQALGGAPQAPGAPPPGAVSGEGLGSMVQQVIQQGIQEGLL